MRGVKQKRRHSQVHARQAVEDGQDVRSDEVVSLLAGLYSAVEQAAAQDHDATHRVYQRGPCV